MAQILPALLPHLRFPAPDTGAREGIAWLLYSWWRVTPDRGLLLAHSRTVVVDAGTHDGGSSLPERVRRDAASMAKITEALDRHPHPLCPGCGAGVTLQVCTAGNTGPILYTSVPNKPWVCPACGSTHPMPHDGPNTAHARMDTEARWNGLTPEGMRW